MYTCKLPWCTIVYIGRIHTYKIHSFIHSLLLRTHEYYNCRNTKIHTVHLWKAMWCSAQAYVGMNMLRASMHTFRCLLSVQAYACVQERMGACRYACLFEYHIYAHMLVCVCVCLYLIWITCMYICIGPMRVRIFACVFVSMHFSVGSYV